jgi:hypothetical protein
MKPYKIACIAIDSPDTFSGYHLPVLQVPITQRQYTCREIAQEINSELNSNFDYYLQYEELFDNYSKVLALKDDEVFFCADSLFDSYFEYLQSEDDFIEYMYFYFAPIAPVTLNGVTFLDN